MAIVSFSIIIALVMMLINGTSMTVAQNEIMFDNHNATSIYSQTIQPPLIQYRSGINEKNIMCNLGLQLIFKAEDNSPACVKPNTAQKLLDRGWTKSISIISETSSNLQCDGTVIPPGSVRTGMVPVLMMEPNSNATICVTYEFTSDWNSYPNKDIYPHGTFETTCCNFDTKKFEVLSNPSMFNITGIYNGTTVTVMYKIYAAANSTGFYNSSFPFGSCNSYPLAVGYDPSQINASEFSSYMMEIPCYNTIHKVEIVKIVSGMTYKEIQFK